MKTILVSAITAALVAVSLLAFNAYAGRSAGGTYTLASPGVPFQSGQVISSTQMNNTFNDIATTLTNSLDRNGNGGMLAALRGIDGTAAAPAFSWTSETNSGFYRIGTGNIGLSLSGTKYSDWSATVGGPVQTTTIPGSASTTAATWLEAALSDGNLVNLRIGKAIGSGTDGILTYTKNATALNSTLCLGVDGGSASALCVDGTNKTTAAGALAVTGSTTLGSSGTTITTFQVKAGNVGCTTAASIGAICDLTITWPAAFADTAYKGWCNGYAGTGSGNPILQGSSPLTTTTYNVRTVALTAVASQFGTIDCFAVHL